MNRTTRREVEGRPQETLKERAGRDLPAAGDTSGGESPAALRINLQRVELVTNRRDQDRQTCLIGCFL